MAADQGFHSFVVGNMVFPAAGMELMPTRWRGAWTAYSHIMFATGLATLGAVSWALPYWRWMLRVLYGSSLLCLAALW